MDSFIHSVRIQMF